MADRKFSNNRYFGETLLNKNDLPNNSAFINITQARSNSYTRDAKEKREDLWNTLIHPRDQFRGNIEWL